MTTTTSRGRDLSAPDRPTSFCPMCLPAVVIDMGRSEIAHEARCPAGLLPAGAPITGAHGGSQSQGGAR